MKIYAPKGKLFYCEKLGIYCTCTTDEKHEWIKVDEKEKEDE